MTTEEPGWEPMVCVSIACVLDVYQVARVAGARETWLVAETPTSRPFTEAATAPFCPRCGGDLVAAPAHGIQGRAVA